MPNSPVTWPQTKSAAAQVLKLVKVSRLSMAPFYNALIVCVISASAALASANRYRPRKLTPCGYRALYSATPVSMVMNFAPSAFSTSSMCSSMNIRCPRPITCGWNV